MTALLLAYLAGLLTLPAWFVGLLVWRREEARAELARENFPLTPRGDRA